MTLFRLTDVIYGCTVMTYGSRQRGPKVRTSQPCSTALAAIRATARRRGETGGRVFDFSPPSLPVPATGPAPGPTCRSERVEASVHRQAFSQFDSAGAVVRICQEGRNQRSRESSAPSVLATRGRSWLSRRRSRLALCSWSIDLTACCQKSWLRPIRCWCQTGVERCEGAPSHPPNFSRR